MQTTRLSLDREWRFTRNNHSVLPALLNHETTYAFSKGNGAQGPAMLNFDDSAWEEVTLPHDWQHAVPFDLTGISSHGYHPSGACWYRRTFLLDPSDMDAEIQLAFDGISGISDIYFNGAKLLHNESCYNGFSLSLSDIANFGATPNVVAVRVDKTFWEGWWYEGCGINRHCCLIKRPRLHVIRDGLWIKPCKQPTGKWLLPCEVTVYNTSNDSVNGKLCVHVLDPAGTEVAKSMLSMPVASYERRSFFTECTVADPELWDIDQPNLYSLSVELTSPQGVDCTQVKFGFRTIRVDPESGFWLNNRPIKLLGTCNHQDHAGVGAAIPKELWRYRLSLLKQMGSNALRCSHNPPPPELLDLCDEMGILVMDENRCYSTAEYALDLLRSMVRRDRNHPCVIMYSLFNEEPMQGTPVGKRLVLHQRAELEKLDNTRPVLGAFNGGFFEKDGAGTCLDITGINYFVDSYDSFHQKYPKQPIVASELASAFATRGQCESDVQQQVFGNYDEDCASWGETARVANIAVLTRPFVMGMFIWTGFDYRGEPTPYEWPSVSSHFGIMDTCGFAKDVYYFYQAFWKQEPILHLFPHWNHPNGKRIRVMAYTNLNEVELFLNGRSLGKKTTTPAYSPEWEVVFEAGTILAKGYRNGLCILTDERQTTGAPDRLLFEQPMFPLYADTDSVVAVTFYAADSDSRECPIAKNRTSFTVEGGTLLGVGNGDPNCHDPDIANACRLFHGRCQLIIAALPNAHEVTLNATGHGLRPAKLTLSIHNRPALAELPSTGIRLIDGWRMSHVATAQRPDPAASFNSNDMNSMEAVSFVGVPQATLDGLENMFCLYQTKIMLNGTGEQRYLILNRARGMVEILLNDQTICKKHCFTDERVEALIPPDMQGTQRLSIIIQNCTVDKRAGIIDPIILINTAKEHSQ